MSSESQQRLTILSELTGLVCQTLFYGIYAALIPFSTHFFLKKKTMTRGNKFMFSITLFMFLLSTAFWIVSVTHLFAQIDGIFASSQDESSGPFSPYVFFNALLLINYILTDSVVVWRAWVLCKDESKKVLMVPLFFLVCTSLSVLETIGVRSALSGGARGLKTVIDISQISNLVLSLLTNVTATSIVGFRAWRIRQSIREMISRERDTSTKVERVMTLLVESGLIYCISGILVLLASFIHLPHGTLGDIYTPVHVQVAGIYPTVVLVLVSRERSLKEGVFSTSGAVTGIPTVQIGSMNFRSNPAMTVSTITPDERTYNVIEESASSDSGSVASARFSKKPKQRLDSLT